MALELMQSEFRKPRHEQSLDNLDLYANVVIDLAIQDSLMDRQLEKIFLSSSSMDIPGDYFYLIANLLRHKVSDGDSRDL